MPPYAPFHLGLHCMPKYPFRGSKSSTVSCDTFNVGQKCRLRHIIRNSVIKILARYVKVTPMLVS